MWGFISLLKCLLWWKKASATHRPKSSPPPPLENEILHGIPLGRAPRLNSILKGEGKEEIATSIRVTPRQNGPLFEPPKCTVIPRCLCWWICSNTPAADVRSTATQTHPRLAKLMFAFFWQNGQNGMAYQRYWNNVIFGGVEWVDLMLI